MICLHVEISIMRPYTLKEEGFYVTPIMTFKDMTEWEFLRVKEEYLYFW